MKFDEFRKLCPVVEMILNPVERYWEHKDVKKCIEPDCGYAPQHRAWLDENGRCSLCAERVRRRQTTADVFSTSYPEMCMRCSEAFHNLDRAGYCPKCRATLIEENAKEIKARAYSRLPHDASALGFVFGKFWCHKCSRFGAVEERGVCPQCKDQRVVLQRYLCTSCYKEKAFVLGGVCTECAIKVGAGTGPTYVAATRTTPRLVKFEKTKEGGFIERATEVPTLPGRVLTMSEKLGTDSRLGIRRE